MKSPGELISIRIVPSQVPPPEGRQSHLSYSSSSFDAVRNLYCYFHERDLVQQGVGQLPNATRHFLHEGRSRHSRHARGEKSRQACIAWLRTALACKCNHSLYPGQGKGHHEYPIAREGGVCVSCGSFWQKRCPFPGRIETQANFRFQPRCVSPVTVSRATLMLFLILPGCRLMGSLAHWGYTEAE